MKTICFLLFFFMVHIGLSQSVKLHTLDNEIESHVFSINHFPAYLSCKVIHNFLSFEDTIIVDKYRFHHYQSSEIWSHKTKDTTHLATLTFTQDGTYQLNFYTTKGFCLGKTSCYLSFKTKNGWQYQEPPKYTPLSIHIQSEAVILQNDSTLLLYKKRKNQVLPLKVTSNHLPETDSLRIVIHRYQSKKEEYVMVETLSATLKEKQHYEALFNFRKKNTGIYRFSVFDIQGCWYGAIQLQIED